MCVFIYMKNVPIRDIQDKTSHGTTFIQLKPRLANVLISALQVETDSLNIQMLLGGLIMLVSDTAAFEDVDKPPVPLGAESPTNLLSSGKVSYIHQIFLGTPQFITLLPHIYTFYMTYFLLVFECVVLAAGFFPKTFVCFLACRKCEYAQLQRLQQQL